MKNIGIGTLNFNKEMFRKLLKNFNFIKNQKFFIDTSPNYGKFYAEKSLKTLLKNDREKYFIASKFGLEFDDKKKTFSKKIKLDRNYIIQSLDKTLKNLGIKYLDLYQIHSYNYNSDHASVIDTLLQLKKEKKILNIGCVNFNYEQIKRYEKKKNNKFFDYVQVHYNFFERQAEKKIIPYCIKYKKKIIVNRIFGSGIFVKRNNKYKNKRLFLSERLLKKYKLHKKKILFFFNELEKLNIDEKYFLISWMKKFTRINVLLFGVSQKNDIKNIITCFNKPLNIESIRYIDKIMKRNYNLYNLPKSFHE